MAAKTQMYNVQKSSDGSLSLERLVADYGNYLHMMARLQVDRLLQSKVDPADLVQEAALLAVRDFEQFRGTTEAEFVAWLREILSNVCAATVRKYFQTKSRDVFQEQQLRENLDQSSFGLSRMFSHRQDSPSQSAVRRETAVLMADALATLPEECREVLIRRHLRGQSLVDMGKELGKSRHAVGRLIAKATVLLQSAMEEYRV